MCESYIRDVGKTSDSVYTGNRIGRDLSRLAPSPVSCPRNYYHMTIVSRAAAALKSHAADTRRSSYAGVTRSCCVPRSILNRQRYALRYGISGITMLYTVMCMHGMENETIIRFCEYHDVRVSCGYDNRYVTDGTGSADTSRSAIFVFLIPFGLAYDEFSSESCQVNHLPSQRDGFWLNQITFIAIVHDITRYSPADAFRRGVPLFSHIPLQLL